MCVLSKRRLRVPYFDFTQKGVLAGHTGIQWSIMDLVWLQLEAFGSVFSSAIIIQAIVMSGTEGVTNFVSDASQSLTVVALNTTEDKMNRCCNEMGAAWNYNATTSTCAHSNG